MRKSHFDKLRDSGIVSDEQHSNLLNWLLHKPFSLHWEIRILLYAGVLLLTSGLGIIVYQNIDTIGHTVIIMLITLACAGCFYYCFKNKLPYQHLRENVQNPWFDYILLLGCLLFLSLEGYLQYQYNVFGTRYGLAMLIPAVLFLVLAYIFDHIGVLSLGITSLASFAGITASPGMILHNQFSEAPLVFTGLAYAVLLIVGGYFLKERNIKRHFTFTFYNFGFNVLFICLLSGVFTLRLPFIYFGFLVLGCTLLVRFAIKEQSFYFLFISVIYSYIGITWVAFQAGITDVFAFYYFAISCVGVIYFFINYKKILKIK